MSTILPDLTDLTARKLVVPAVTTVGLLGVYQLLRVIIGPLLVSTRGEPRQSLHVLHIAQIHRARRLTLVLPRLATRLL